MTVFPTPRQLALLAALTTAVAGLWALAAWTLNEWQLVSVGAGYIPMAPPTALLFVVLGLALAAQERWPESRGVRSAGATGALLALSVSGLVILQGWLDLTLPWTDWLVRVPARVGEIPVGVMSPVTALCFFLTAGVLLGQSFRWTGRAAVRRAAYAVNGAVLAIAGTVALSYVTGTPLFYRAGIVPMALLTALAFVALSGSLFLSGLLDRLMRQWRGHDDGAHVPEGGRAYTRRLLLVGGALGVLIIVTGILYLRREQADARTVVYQQLAAIAQLKAEQIRAWRIERMGEARFLYHTTAVVTDIAAFAAQPGDPAARARVLDWLEPIKGGDRYEFLAVLDLQARPMLTIPAAALPDATGCIPPALFAQVLASQEPVFLDLQRDAGDPAPHLDLLVPIHSRLVAGGRQSPPVAVVLLRLDPRHFLFPLLQDWPLPSATAESILVRRVDDTVVYLSDVRHRAGAALTLRRSVNDPALPAAQAGRGEYGVQEGVDYRGIPVLAATRPIPDSPWILIAKVDLAEAYSSIQRDAWQTGLAVLFLLLAMGLAGTSLWRWRHAEFLRRALTTEQERQAMAERLGLVMRHANDSIFVMDAAGRILDANDRALTSYGYTLAELRTLPTGGLRPPLSSVGVLQKQMDRLASESGAVFETEHRRKDGSIFPVEVSGRKVMIGGQPHLLGIYRDITERKTHEREIDRLNRMYLVISQINQAIVRAKSSAGMFPEICRVLVELGGFKIAWIGWPNQTTQQLVPVAVAGDAQNHVQELKISLDPAAPKSHGPSGIAFRENRVSVCNDILADPVMRPWHELARSSGIQSVIALPLRQGGTVRGVLCVYAAELNFFGPREFALLEEAAGDLSFVLDVFDGEARRQEAEAALQASEGRLQFLITATPAIIYSLRADDLGTTFLSPNIREVLGYNPEPDTLKPEFWRSNLHPDDAAAAQAGITALLRPDGPSTLTREYRFRHADGSWRWMHDELRAVRDAAGRPQELVGYWIEINQRKQAEERLQTSEKEFRQLAEAMPQIVWITRPDGGNIYFNQQWVSYTGLTLEESTGHGWNIPFHPDDRQRAWDAWQHAIRDNGTYTLECRLRRADGIYRWWLIRGVPVRAAHGEIIKWFGTCTDIEEIKQSESALRQAETRYHGIFDHAREGIVQTTPAGEILVCNPALARIFGYATPADFMREVSSMASRYVDPAQRGEMLRRLQATGSVEGFDMQMRHQDGRIIWTSANIQVVSDEKGEQRYEGTLEDVTARKQAELQGAVELRVFEMLARARPLPEILDGLARAYEELCPGMLCSVLLLDAGGKQLRHGAAPSLPAAYLAIVDGLEIGPDAFSCGTAAFTGRTVITADIATDPLWTRGRALAQRHGLRACWSMPILGEASKVLGTLALYFSEPRTPQPEELAMHERAAYLASLAILQHLAREALRESQAFYHALVEQLPAGVFRKDLAGRYVFVSPWFCLLKGIKAEEFLGRTSVEVAGGEAARLDASGRAIKHAADGEDHHRLIMETGRHIELVEEYPLPDGRKQFVHVIKTPVIDRDGKIIGSQGILFDITASKQAEAALRESEEMLQEAQTIAGLGSYDLDVATGRWRSSEMLDQVFGIGPGFERSFAGWEKLLHPGDREEMSHYLKEQVIGKGKPFDREYRIVRQSDRAERWVWGMGKLDIDPSGRVRRMRGTIQDITERKKAEEELRFRNAILNTQQDLSLDGILVVDDNDHIISHNARFCAMWGVPQKLLDDKIDLPVLQRVATRVPDPQAFLARIRSIYAHPDKTSQDEILLADGRIFDRYSAPMFGAERRYYGRIWYFRDITDRRQAEQQLQKLSRVVEQSPTSVIITDLTGAIEYVNPWFCRQTGYTPGEVLGQNPRMLKSGQTPAATYLEMWQTLSASRTWRGELVNKKKNGEVFTELVVVAPVFGPDGCPSHYVAIKEDITERKRLETLTRKTLEQFNTELEQKVELRTEELAARTRQIQALLSSIPDTVMRLRADGTVLLSQPAHQGAATLSSLTPPEGTPPAAGASAEFLAASLALGRRALAEGTTVIGETEIATPGGTLALELRTAPTGADEFVVFARDITARKRLEGETVAMLEKERQVSEMKTRFIAVISHEFRTPMTAIAGSVELLAHHLDRLSATKRAEILERISRSQLRMTAMLDDVLTLNRMDLNRSEVRLTTVNLEPFLQNIISELRAADRDAHPFKLELAGATAAFVTDPNLLNHIVANLLGNAVRYSPVGTTVTVRANRDAWRLHLSVEDQGIGIPPADRVRIFEPFERGSNVGQIKGTGLGLNIVKRLTELLGGNVSLRQLAGGGTRFNLAFPLLPPPDPLS